MLVSPFSRVQAPHLCCGAKPHGVTGHANTVVDVKALVPARCWAQVRYDCCAAEQFFVPVSTTLGWRGMLKTRASCLRPGPLAFPPQILAAALTECHRKSSAQGKPLALKVFVAGRNRLENDGATALAEAFGVSGFCPWSPSDLPLSQGGGQGQEQWPGGGALGCPCPLCCLCSPLSPRSGPRTLLSLC